MTEKGVNIHDYKRHIEETGLDAQERYDSWYEWGSESNHHGSIPKSCFEVEKDMQEDVYINKMYNLYLVDDKRQRKGIAEDLSRCFNRHTFQNICQDSSIMVLIIILAKEADEHFKRLYDTLTDLELREFILDLGMFVQDNKKYIRKPENMDINHLYHRYEFIFTIILKLYQNLG